MIGSGEWFVVAIKGGNDAMRDGYDIANALLEVADRVSNGDSNGSIIDVNGSTVGRFDVYVADIIDGIDLASPRRGPTRR